MAGSLLRVVAVHRVNRSRLETLARSLLVASAIALAPGRADASPDAASTIDAVTRCEDGLRTGRGLSELVPACADLYSKAACRAAFRETAHPDDYLARALGACAREYCSVLPEPRTAACAALARDGARVSSDTEVAALLRELSSAILRLEHDRPALERLAVAARRSRLGREERAFEIAFALCVLLPGAPVKTASGDTVQLTPGAIDRLRALQLTARACAVRRAGPRTTDDVYRMVIASRPQAPGPPTDHLVVELRYRADPDAFEVASLAEASSDGPEPDLAYRTQAGLVLVPQPSTPDDGLRVEIRRGGVSFFVGRRPVGPGCILDVPGVAFPGGAGKVEDRRSMRRCAERLRREVPALAQARVVDVRSARDVPMRTVKAVLGALGRGDDQPPLFPDVNFGVLEDGEAR